MTEHSDKKQLQDRNSQQDGLTENQDETIDLQDFEEGDVGFEEQNASQEPDPVIVSPQELTQEQANELGVQVVFECEHYIVISKPVGLMVHGDGRQEAVTLADWVAHQYPEIYKNNVGEPMRMVREGVVYHVARPGIVHRLDKDTTGIMVIARTPQMHQCLKTQFKNRRIKKTYHAFVYGFFKEDRGMVDRPIGRSKNDFRKWTAQRSGRGEKRDAKTQYAVKAQKIVELQKENGEWVEHKAAFVECWPHTGRTHQIRVHLDVIGHPIVGDALYAQTQTENMPKFLGFERTALHAARLGFYTIDGEMVYYNAAHPEDFVKGLELLK